MLEDAVELGELLLIDVGVPQQSAAVCDEHGAQRARLAIDPHNDVVQDGLYLFV